jgi:hypothetical protein
MTIQNAIKKLEKNGFKVEKSEFDKPEQYNRTFYATNPSYKRFIEIMTQGDDLSIIDLRTPGHDDDLMTDYHAGTFCKNITQAIRYVTTW